MIPLSRHDVNPLLHVTDDTETRCRATSISTVMTNRVMIVIAPKSLTPIIKSQDVVMAAGGKCLRANSSTRSVGASDQPKTRVVVTPSNGADDNLPSLHRSTRVAPRRSSCASTSGIRHVRGRMRGLALEKACIVGKLSVHILDGRTGGDDKASLMLSSHIGCSCDHMSRSMWSTDDFNLDYDRPEDRNTVMSTMNTAYRTHQNRMHEYYALFPPKRSVRASINPALMYKKTHNKDGAWTSDTAWEHFEKMEALQLQRESEGRSFTEVEIFTEVLGTKAGYVCGLGRSVRQVGSSSSVSSIDLARRLEVARMELDRKNMMS
ncbi:hypothetical protein CJ030_MR5G024783 [Morella rubra]|uniref:Uncharacterized protein n=1 Tax=Morella rubra TaxID=262757 RepID=A0A6A1VMN9_9ROSI|nr:hypothetical protein CJ030_MR5G024783 [Morella rubra]